jgi:hypothetical protein
MHQIGRVECHACGVGMEWKGDYLFSVTRNRETPLKVLILLASAAKQITNDGTDFHVRNKCSIASKNTA